jgi:hypothetical protein
MVQNIRDPMIHCSWLKTGYEKLQNVVRLVLNVDKESGT